MDARRVTKEERIILRYMSDERGAATQQTLKLTSKNVPR